MSIASIPHISLTEGRDCSARCRPEWKIDVLISVAADRGRVHAAITIPEYMETWMQLPEAGEERAAVFAVPGGFRIARANGASKDTILCARYRVCRRSKAVFTCVHDRFANPSGSIVTIRSFGDFARTKVQLTQVGSGSQEECWWHYSFWRRSLSRLEELFRNCATRAPGPFNRPAFTASISPADRQVAARFSATR